MARTPQYPMLVVDAGNSSVKFASVARAGGTPRFLRSVPTDKLSAVALRRLSVGMKSVFVSSVAPSATRILKQSLPRARFIGPRTKLDFKTLADRATIGSDRLANVAAAHAIHGHSIVVASFGTAATFDLIDAKGIHRGGAIAPGWKTFCGILSEKTALLPRAEARRATRLAGRNTREAMRAGVAGGYAAMAGALLAGLKKEAGATNMRIVFTGGDAPTVAKLLRLKAVSDPLLTLRGIAILGR